MSCEGPLFGSNFGCECQCFGGGSEDEAQETSSPSSAGSQGTAGTFANDEVSVASASPGTKGAAAGGSESDAGPSDGSSDGAGSPAGVGIAEATLGDSLESLSLLTPKA